MSANSELPDGRAWSFDNGLIGAPREFHRLIDRICYDVRRRYHSVLGRRMPNGDREFASGWKNGCNPPHRGGAPKNYDARPRTRHESIEWKIALITGATQGIGATMAKQMADQGVKVVITGVLDTSGTVDSVKGSSGEALGLKVDVTSNEDLAAMVEAAKSTLGGVDILVDNAGIFATPQPKPFHMIDEDEFDRVMRVNVRGIHQATKTVVPAMVKRGGARS